MADVAVTYSFSANTTAASGEVNQNFTDLVNYVNNRNGGSATWDALYASSASNNPVLRINNSTGTNNIANFQDNGTNVFTIADGGATTITATAGGSSVPLTVNNNTSSGHIALFQDAGTTMHQFSDGGGVVFNENGNDADFRIEGDTNIHAFFLDTSSESVGLGLSGPTAILHAKKSAGTASLAVGRFDAAVASYTGTVLIAECSLTAASDFNYFEVASDSDGDSGGRVVQFLIRGDGLTGVGHGSPTSKLHVAGVTGTTVAAIINNGTSTGNILNCLDNGTNVVAVADGGATTISALNGGSSIPLTVNNGTSTGSILAAQDNGTTIFLIADGGNVGVGASVTNTAKFNVGNTSAASAIQITGASAADSGPALTLLRSGSTNWVIAAGGTNATDLVISTPTNAATYTDANLASAGFMRIQNDGLVVFNESGAAAADFRIEGDTNANLFFLDSSANQIFFGGTSAGAGTLTYTSGGGIQMGAPTGGDKGSGTANFAADIYKNDSAYANPDYVLEHWATGKIDKFKGNPGAADYPGVMPLEKLEDYIRTHHDLPRVKSIQVDGQGQGIFARSDIALEKIEELFVYIVEFNNRLKKLEGV